MKLLTGLALTMLTSLSHADQIRVPSGGAARSFIELLAASFDGHSVKLAGPLPAELQKFTVYVAVPVTSSSRQQGVSDFLKHLTRAEARERPAQAGYTSPE